MGSLFRLQPHSIINATQDIRFFIGVVWRFGLYFRDYKNYLVRRLNSCSLFLICFGALFQLFCCLCDKDNTENKHDGFRSRESTPNSGHAKQLR